MTEDEQKKHVSLEVTFQATIERDEVEIVDWQLKVNPPEEFDALSPAVRAAFWSKLRDEIEECWFSAALGSDPDALWNWLLEEIDLG
jgi:hypothetical protein